MSTEEEILVFFDASCIIAACGSPTGGSARVLAECGDTLLRAVTNQEALAEAERNIKKKLGADALERFYAILAEGNLTIAPSVTPEQETTWLAHVNPKDVHLVASAINFGCIHLLTLDRTLVNELIDADIGVLPWSPGEFIRSVISPLLSD